MCGRIAAAVRESARSPHSTRCSTHGKTLYMVEMHKRARTCAHTRHLSRGPCTARSDRTHEVPLRRGSRSGMAMPPEYRPRSECRLGRRRLRIRHARLDRIFKARWAHGSRHGSSSLTSSELGLDRIELAVEEVYDRIEAKGSPPRPSAAAEPLAERAHSDRRQTGSHLSHGAQRRNRPCHRQKPRSKKKSASHDAR